MRALLLSVGIGVLLAADPSLSAPAKEPEACRLLSAADVSRVQGARVVETRPSRRDAGPLTLSQCFFVLEPFDRSVSLEVARGSAEARSARAVRERWDAIFHQPHEVESERAAESPERASEADEKGRPAEPIAQLGEEAFWLANPASGALYVLSGDVYLRLSVGGPESGPESREAKSAKCRRLAGEVLRRLRSTPVK